jgi:hypothetical protein
MFLKKAYITYIRPLLEYNSNIWNPTQVYFTDLPESVRRGFTKRVKAISKLTYSEVLVFPILNLLNYVDCGMIWYNTTKY